MSVGLRGTTRSGLTASSDRLSRVSPSLDVLSFSEDEAVLRRGNRASLQSLEINFGESPENMQMKLQEALQIWMVGFMNKNARREQLIHT